ncbi:hypothetical protein [Streptomyces chrestomyceticus]|uniref:hypothetical protein n=1 Tax=Streptomyces chrestomyceticus TaxID=68185 RepID=UPI0019D11BE1|nr:hypothetical protein [Streptomyces chrestomyceticus]
MAENAERRGDELAPLLLTHAQIVQVGLEELALGGSSPRAFQPFRGEADIQLVTWTVGLLRRPSDLAGLMAGCR